MSKEPKEPKSQKNKNEIRERASRDPEVAAAPLPENRIIQPGHVRVRARRAIGGLDGVHIPKGQVFETSEDRAAALGSSVEPFIEEEKK